MSQPKTKNNSATLEQTGQGQFRISGELDFQSVPIIWERSREMFDSSDSLVVDLEGVVRCNSAGLALLIEWMRYAKSYEKRISFHHIPEQMREIAEACGVDQFLPTPN